jgi:hypothetical protein
VTTVACSATDRAGNTATGSFTVTVWTPSALVRSLSTHCDRTRSPGLCRAALSALARALDLSAHDYPARYAQLAAAMTVASRALAQIGGVPAELTSGLRTASRLAAAEVRRQLLAEVEGLRRLLAGVPGLGDELDALAGWIGVDVVMASVALDRLESAIRRSTHLVFQPDLRREALAATGEIRQALRALRVV